ncbi:hypothetical protein NPIL_171911, partial [Nephila pilipes]
MLLSEYSSL